jgi:O-antigen/teichoic acid export membrane protein
MAPVAPKPTNDARAAGRGAAALAIFQTVGRALGLAFVVIATREVSPTNFGRYSTVAALLVVVGFLSDLGTTAATTKLVSTGSDADRVLRDSLSACLALGFAAWGVGEVAALIAYPHVVVVDFAVLGVSLPIDACLTTLLGALDGSGAISRRAVLSFVRLGLAAITASVLVLTTHSIRLGMAGLAAGPLVALIACVVVVRRMGVWRGRVRLSPLHGLPLIVAAIPFAAISGLAVVNARVDVLVVSVLNSRAVTANYDIAVRVLEGCLYVIAAFSGPTLYIFSRRMAAGDHDGVQRAYDRTLRVFYLIGLPIAAVLITLGSPLVRALFGPAYHRAGLYVAIFGTQVWLMFVSGLQGMAVVAIPKMRQAVALIAGLNLVHITLQVVFIVVAGPVGGAVSYPVCQVISIGAQAVFLRRRAQLRTIRVPPVGLLVATGASAGVALALRSQPVAFAAAAALAVFGGLLIATRTVGRQDLIEAKGLFGPQAPQPAPHGSP